MLMTLVRSCVVLHWLLHTWNVLQNGLTIARCLQVYMHLSTGIHASEQHIHRAQHNFSGNKPSEDFQRVLITVTVLLSNTQKKQTNVLR